MVNASILEYTLVGGIALSFMSSLGAQPSYNPVMAVFSIYAYYSNNARIVAWNLAMLVMTIVFDVTWCGIYGPDIRKAEDNTVQASSSKFALAMTILYMFLKIPQVLLFFAHLNSLGGIEAARDADGGAAGGQTGGHYSEFDAPSSPAAPSSYQQQNAKYQQPDDSA